MVQAKSQKSESRGYRGRDSFSAGRQSTFNWRGVGEMVSGFIKTMGDINEGKSTRVFGGP
jgi:hypothetical protein